MKRASTFLLIALAPFLGSCNRLIVDVSQPLITSIETGYLLESDVELARESFPTLLKIAEGMARFESTSPYYPSKLCFLTTAYAFAYLDESPWGDLDAEADEKEKRLLAFYERGFRWGMMALERGLPGFEKQLRDPATADKAVARLEKRHVEAAFWMDFAWAMRILGNTSDVKLVTELEMVRKIAERCAALDPKYLQGASYAILMAYYGGRTAATGGSPALAASNETVARGYAAGKSLIPDYVALRYIATLQADSKEFDRRANDILAFDATRTPELRFLNEVVLKKTRALVKKKSHLF